MNFVDDYKSSPTQYTETEADNTRVRRRADISPIAFKAVRKRFIHVADSCKEMSFWMIRTTLFLFIGNFLHVPEPSSINCTCYLSRDSLSDLFCLVRGSPLQLAHAQCRAALWWWADSLSYNLLLSSETRDWHWTSDTRGYLSKQEHFIYRIKTHVIHR